MPRTASFVFTRAAPPDSLPADYVASLRWATRDGSALAGRHYTAGAGTLTFEPGDLYKIVSVVVADTPPDQPARSFYLVLRDPVGCSLVRGFAKCVIPSTYPAAEQQPDPFAGIGVPDAGYDPSGRPTFGIGVPA